MANPYACEWCSQDHGVFSDRWYVIDRDTRLIDVDFGQITLSTARTGGDEVPNNVTTGGVGVGQLLNVLPAGQFNGGSFIQYVRLDLDYMTRNNEVMMPTEASIQRTSPVPLGS